MHAFYYEFQSIMSANLCFFEVVLFLWIFFVIILGSKAMISFLPPNLSHSRLSNNHRVGRVPSFLSSRRNWDSPTPSPAGECVLPSFGSGGIHTHCGRGGGGPNSDRHYGTQYTYLPMHFVFTGMGDGLDTIYRQYAYMCEILIDRQFFCALCS